MPCVERQRPNRGRGKKDSKILRNFTQTRSDFKTKNITNLPFVKQKGPLFQRVFCFNGVRFFMVSSLLQHTHLLGHNHNIYPILLCQDLLLWTEVQFSLVRLCTSGCADKTRAATPATCGDAIEVPGRSNKRSLWVILQRKSAVRCHRHSHHDFGQRMYLHQEQQYRARYHS